MDDFFNIEAKELEKLKKNLSLLVPSMQKKMGLMILKSSIRSSRNELRNYIKTTYGKSYKPKKDPRRLFKSVTTVKAKEIRKGTNKGGLIGFFYFKNDHMLKKEWGVSGERPAPGTIAHWLSYGTNPKKGRGITADNFLPNAQKKLREKFSEEMDKQISLFIGDYLKQSSK